MKRLPLPDLLKGLAVFVIIPIHIMETFIDYPGRESLFGKGLLLPGGPVAVPVFMMVMGYFVAMSKKSTGQNMFRGILIFILGILLNIGLNFHLLIKIKFYGWQLNPLQAIFGVDIFLLAGLSIIILTVLKTIKNRQQWITLALILFISGSTSYLNEILMVTERNYILPFIGGNYSWSYFPLFPWLSYPLVGFLIQKQEQHIRVFVHRHKALRIAFPIIVFLLVVIFSGYGIETTINLDKYYHHNFFFFLWTLGVDLLWLLFIRLIVRKFSQFPLITFFEWLGKNITVFYIIQWLIIGNIATAIYQTQELSNYAYWFIAIFITTTALTYLYEKIRMKLIHSRKLSLDI
jgi:hypothetical protein